jgi:hypothetical protein
MGDNTSALYSRVSASGDGIQPSARRSVSAMVPWEGAASAARSRTCGRLDVFDTVFKRLSQNFEHVAAELGQLIYRIFRYGTQTHCSIVCPLTHPFAGTAYPYGYDVILHIIRLLLVKNKLYRLMK